MIGLISKVCGDFRKKYDQSFSRKNYDPLNNIELQLHPCAPTLKIRHTRMSLAQLI